MTTLSEFTEQVERHIEKHYINRSGWLRAAVLGANDGIISISSLVIGVASASASQSDIALAGIAGLVAGALSMAAGEYVSVCSQSDLENADLEKEKRELLKSPDHELEELVEIMQSRGLDFETATKAAEQMTEHDALAAHAREELGISDLTTAQPLEAAFASGLAFTMGGIWPVLAIFVVPHDYFYAAATILCLALLGMLGALGAKMGGSKIYKPALRVMFWGAIAMGISYIVGDLVGTHL